MDSSSRMIECLLVFVIAASIHSATAQRGTRHVVGGNAGWTVGTGASTYTTWAASQTFNVGDTLVFNFDAGRHDVATVSKAAFEACNAATTLVPTITSSPATITLNSAGEHYYFCSFAGHCLAGQKLAINVTSSSRASPPTARTPTPPSTIATPPSTTATPPTSSMAPPPTSGGSPPPPSSSAPAHALAGISTILLSAAALLL